MKKRIMVPIIVIGLLLTSFSAMSVNASFGETQEAIPIDFEVDPIDGGDDNPQTTGITIYVDDDGGADYTKIQDAINAASDGDTIYVYSGTYYEKLTINKIIDLIGEDRETTIIDGCSGGTAVHILDVDGVTVSGFTIQNCRYWIGAGITVFNSSCSQISNNIIKNNDYGIWIAVYSNNSIITNNIITMNRDCGIFIEIWSNNNNHISNNIISNSRIGIGLFDFSFFNVIENNILSSNVRDIVCSQSSFDSSDNQFLHNLKTSMLTLDEVNRVRNLYDTVSFNIQMFKPNGDPCYIADYNIYTRPFEPLSISKNGNEITGSFTVTRLGTYSLIAEIKDINNNRAKTKYVFFVDPSGSVKTRYYLRGVEPIHGQPAGSDAKSLLFTPPVEEEYWRCGAWVQNSPDELTGEYTLSVLDEIDIHSWYKLEREGGIGVQRFVTFDPYVDREQVVGAAEDYTWVNTKFTDLDWSMDYSWSLYFTSLKLRGLHSFWMTNPIQPSYADFTFRYTTTPTIKSISNKKVTVLSATSPPGNTNYAHIVLEGTESTNLVVQMPDTSLIYSAKLNDDDCDFTQLNGELNFNLCLDSSYSEHLLYIYTSDNQQPEEPVTPDGPTSGEAGVKYNYTTSTVDPDGDQVYYLWHWGDEISNWMGPFDSGETIEASHIWDEKGAYNIRVKAKDIYGAESEWSDPLSVSMPKNKENNNKDDSTRQSLFSRIVDGFRGSTDGSDNNLFSTILTKLFTPRTTTTTGSSLLNTFFSKLLNLNLR